jgi:hypothetical protein
MLQEQVEPPAESTHNDPRVGALLNIMKLLDNNQIDPELFPPLMQLVKAIAGKPGSSRNVEARAPLPTEEDADADGARRTMAGFAHDGRWQPSSWGSQVPTA